MMVSIFMSFRVISISSLYVKSGYAFCRNGYVTDAASGED